MDPGTGPAAGGGRPARHGPVDRVRLAGRAPLGGRRLLGGHRCCCGRHRPGDRCCCRGRRPRPARAAHDRAAAGPGCAGLDRAGRGAGAPGAVGPGSVRPDAEHPGAGISCGGRRGPRPPIVGRRCRGGAARSASRRVDDAAVARRSVRPGAGRPCRGGSRRSGTRRSAAPRTRAAVATRVPREPHRGRRRAAWVHPAARHPADGGGPRNCFALRRGCRPGCFRRRRFRCRYRSTNTVGRLSSGIMAG